MLPNGSTLPIEFVIDTGFTGDIAILAGVVNFLPHPSPPREFGEGARNSQMI
jgi:predicted aspartyl protease